MGFWTKLIDIFMPVTFKKRQQSDPEPISWFVIVCDDDGVKLDVRPPGAPAWTAQFGWKDIVRICLEPAEDFMASDTVYVFTSIRPESWGVPLDGKGGSDFMHQLVHRGMFDAELAITAFSQGGGGQFFWPPITREEVKEHLQDGN